MKDLSTLRAFVRTRPGFDYCNYGDGPAYRADVRKAGQQLRDAEAMLRYCELFNIEPDYSAFSGRLTPNGSGFDYCTGQYYPLEYRAAVCACIASGIWQWMRGNGHTTGDAIRKAARAEFGRGIASRWFN